MLKSIPFAVSRLIACAAFAGLLTIPNSARAQTAAKPTLYYIPHTHWEGAVFKTREGYLEEGLHHIMQAVALLKKYPDYKFTLDQVAYIRPFIERYPEEAKAFKKYVREGRLGIAGAMDVMPDVIKPGGELFVRQMQYGKLWAREALGVDVKAAWLVDTFGHHPQMPQLLNLAGYTSFWFCRGVPKDEIPSEFIWKGIDGTGMNAIWIPGFYGLFYGPPRDQAAFNNFFVNRHDALNIHVHTNERVGLAGVDVSEPEDYAPPMVTAFNANPKMPITIRYSTPEEFAAVVAKRTNRPVMTDDFNPVFQGTYSSRAELKQITREIEDRLLTAEKLSALATWFGVSSDRKALLDGWEPALFNQTHDLASGVMTDHVYEDVHRGYDASRRFADQLITAKWAAFSSKIDTSGDGIPVVVFNTVGWVRTDSAEVEVGFADTDVHDVSVIDSDGVAIPSQVLRADRYTGGGMIRATVRFLAKDLPSLGYKTYHVVPRAKVMAAQSPATNVLENEFYRVTVDLVSGAITSIVDKSNNWEALSGYANVVARQVDKGDFWELYQGLNGGSYIAMTNKQAVPDATNSILSTQGGGKEGTITRSPVTTEFKVSHPLGSGSFSTTIRLTTGVKRVDVTTELVNNEKFVRYQTLFPINVKDGVNVQEIPFGSLTRPNGIENAAQNWVDYSDGQHGVTLINHGMPGNLVSGNTMLLSLMRAHTVGGYGYVSGFEPGMTSDSGYELGRKMTFRYAIVPHSGTWQQPSAARKGMEFNRPLIVQKAESHAGPLGKKWSAMEVSATNVVMTSFQPGPNGTTDVRLYEAEGKPAQKFKLKLNGRASGATEVNFMGDTIRKLPSGSDGVELSLRPFEIVTVRVKVSAGR
ncbi:MAG: glycoside hydrolase family 38 C-terminal domain-containing protein [Chthonomonadales bacterium]